MNPRQNRQQVYGEGYLGFSVPETIDVEIFSDVLKHNTPNRNLNVVLKPLQRQIKCDIGTRLVCAIVQEYLQRSNWRQFPASVQRLVVEPLETLASVSSSDIKSSQIWQLFALETAINAIDSGLTATLEMPSSQQTIPELDLFIRPDNASPAHYFPLSRIRTPAAKFVKGIAYQFKAIQNLRRLPKEIISASKQLRPFHGGIVGVDLSAAVVKESGESVESAKQVFEQIVIDLEDEMDKSQSRLHLSTRSIAGIDLCCRFFIDDNRGAICRWIIWNTKYRLPGHAQASYQTIGRFYSEILVHPFSILDHFGPVHCTNPTSIKELLASVARLRKGIEFFRNGEYDQCLEIAKELDLLLCREGLPILKVVFARPTLHPVQGSRLPDSLQMGLKADLPWTITFKSDQHPIVSDIFDYTSLPISINDWLEQVVYTLGKDVSLKALITSMAGVNNYTLLDKRLVYFGNVPMTALVIVSIGEYVLSHLDKSIERDPAVFAAYLS